MIRRSPCEVGDARVFRHSLNEAWQAAGKSGTCRSRTTETLDIIINTRAASHQLSAEAEDTHNRDNDDKSPNDRWCCSYRHL